MTTKQWKRMAVLGGAVLVLVPIWALAGWPIAAAAALALLAGWKWDAVEKHSGPLLDFGRAVLPLLLPIVVVAIAGAVAFPAYVQVPLVLALALFAWRAIIVPELGDTLGALRSPFSSRLDRPFGSIGVPALLAVAAVFVVLRPGETYEDHGGLVFLYATIPLWIAAVLLRALGYSTSLVRLLVGVCLALFVGLAASLGGVIPLGDAIHDHIPALTPLTPLVVMAVLLAAASLGFSGRRMVPEHWTGSLQALGLVSAVLAAATLATAAFLYGAGGPGGPATERVDANRPAGKPLPADLVPPSAGLTDRQLAEKYKPVLVLAKGERWRPVAVDSFVADASLVNRAGNLHRHPQKLPDHCPGEEVAGCYRLQLDNQGKCESGDDPCAYQTPAADGEPLGTSYFRVIRQSNRSGFYAFGHPEDFREEAAKGARILIQYWFFYRYNEWQRPILTGTLTQRHQGDWEFVTVGLDRGAAPLFLGYSAHCGGTWRGWSQVEPAPGGSRVHPLVAVALGSHANYVNTDDRRSPEWASCGGAAVPKGSLTLLSYASNIRDETSFGTEITADQMQLIRAREKSFPMSFPGTWGANDLTRLENERENTLRLGPAPATPTYQRAWLDPLVTIFCGEHWDPPPGHSNKDCKG